MKISGLTLAVLIAAIGQARGDLNIYGPNGENLGPNPELELVFPDVISKKELDQLKDENNKLQEKVQKLELQDQQLEDALQNQTYSTPYPVQININNRYDSGYGNGYWPVFGGGIFLSNGTGDRRTGHNDHRGHPHSGVRGHRGMGGGRSHLR